MDTFDIGDRKLIRATFRDDTDTLADPTDVDCRVLQPDGTELDPAPTMASTSTGIWETAVTFDDDGIWQIRVEGTGDVVAAVEERVRVSKSDFYP